MKNPLLEVQLELRARKCKTVKCLFWSSDTLEFTIIPKDYNENAIRSSFNLKPGEDWDAKRCADWIEHHLSDPDAVPQNHNE